MDVVNDMNIEIKTEDGKRAAVDDPATEQEYDTRSEAGSSATGGEGELADSASPDLSSLADDASVLHEDDDDNEDIYANFGKVIFYTHFAVRFDVCFCVCRIDIRLYMIVYFLL